MPPLFHGCLLNLLPSSVSSTWSSQDQALALHPPEPQSKKLFFFINSRVSVILLQEQTTDKHREARFGRSFRNVWFSNEPGAGEGSEFRLGKSRRKEVSTRSVWVLAFLHSHRFFWVAASTCGSHSLSCMCLCHGS